MPNLMYNKGKRDILAGAINLLSDTIKVMAVGSGYTPNADHDYIDMGGANDPVDHRITSTTDQTLANKACTEDDTNDRAYFDADDITYNSVTTGQTIEGLIIYKDTGVPTTSVMICYIDISQATNGGNIGVQWTAGASGGIFYW